MLKDTTLPVSFVGRTERFYVLRCEGLANPAIPKKYAQYSSVSAYDNRTETPVYVDANEALRDFSHALKIYLESLTTTPPAYAPDRDETDLGLSNPINIWHSRFAQLREGRTDAA